MVVVELTCFPKPNSVHTWTNTQEWFLHSVHPYSLRILSFAFHPSFRYCLFNSSINRGVKLSIRVKLSQTVFLWISLHMTDNEYSIHNQVVPMCVSGERLLSASQQLMQSWLKNEVYFLSVNCVVWLNFCAVYSISKTKTLHAVFNSWVKATTV